MWTNNGDIANKFYMGDQTFVIVDDAGICMWKEEGKKIKVIKLQFFTWNSERDRDVIRNWILEHTRNGANPQTER